jgi:hypothetical protein
VRRYFQRLLVDRDLSVCDKLLADDYLDHDAPAGAPRGPGPTRDYVSRMLRDYPDLRLTTEELMSRDRLVAMRARWSGTHRETGVAWRQIGLVLLRVDDTGRIAERWSVYAAT